MRRGEGLRTNPEKHPGAVRDVGGALSFKIRQEHQTVGTRRSLGGQFLELGVIQIGLRSNHLCRHRDIHGAKQR